jgi:hypothetical protein
MKFKTVVVEDTIKSVQNVLRELERRKEYKNEITK